MTPTGFAVRPGTIEDAAAVAELMVVFERAHVEEPDLVDAAEIAGWWSRRDLTHDILLAHDADGTLAAYGMVKEEQEVLDLDVFVHPDRKGHGLGTFMLEWAEREAADRGKTVVRTSGVTADVHAAPLIEGRGYAPVRRFYRMLVDLDAPPPAPVWPEGFTVSAFAPGEEAIFHRVTDEGFAEHWGHVSRSLEEWGHSVFGRGWWDPTLAFLVREGEEPAAAAVNALRFGAGWIGTLAVLKPWRGRGLGRALLLHSFDALYGRGEHRISLAVDAGNETGATHLYESVGMRVVWQADVYERRM